MRKTFKAIGMIAVVFLLASCVYQYEESRPIPQGNVLEEKVTLLFPREIFFLGDEVFFIAFMQENGGSVTPMEQDSNTFWREHPSNAGTQYIEIATPKSLAKEMVKDLAEDIEYIIEFILEEFYEFVDFRKDITSEATRFVFVGDLDYLIASGDAGFLLDFIFPEIGFGEYMRRIFSFYDMGKLEAINFYVKDHLTGEMTLIYDFFADAPQGIFMRHASEDTINRNILFFIEFLLEDIESILAFEKDASPEGTRFIFEVEDIDAIFIDIVAQAMIEIFFREIGTYEHMRRNHMGYNEDTLRNVIFYLKDYNTGELLMVYDFSLNAFLRNR